MDFYIDDAYLTDITVREDFVPLGDPDTITSDQLIEVIKNAGRCYSIGTKDHPGFATLRDYLEHQDYIVTERSWWNGDRVLRSFSLNDVKFQKNDRFPCAAAMKHHLQFQKKNINRRKEGMMPSVFLVSDTHFGHAGVCRFTRSDGVTKLRPWTDPDEMDEAMISAWNDRVRPGDKCYHLGDVVINRKALRTLSRLNGDKVLIRGNHDIFRDDEYREYFRELRAYHVMNGMILSHIPVHEASLGRFGVNIHGHLHANRVMRARGVDARTGEVLYGTDIDVRYHNVSVEQLPDFAPILFEDVLKRITDEGGTIGFRNGNGPTM